MALIDPKQMENVIAQVKQLAIEYRRLTGRPLGITGEVGEYEAARLLNLKLAPARQPGYDGMGPNGQRFQIKTRCLLKGSKASQQVGGIKLNNDWDATLLVLLDDDLNPIEIWEAQRDAVTRELERPGSRARNERGALDVRKFISIAERAWPLRRA
jgi:hypothetical protein